MPFDIIVPVMGKKPDSNTGVQTIMSLEEQLDGGLPRAFPVLKPYLVPPFEVRCRKAGAFVNVAVFARHGSAVLFASLDALAYGDGMLTHGEVRLSHHYPALAMAVRGFIGRSKKPRDS